MHNINIIVFKCHCSECEMCVKSSFCKGLQGPNNPNCEGFWHKGNSLFDNEM